MATRPAVVVGAGLALLTLAAYGRALGNGAVSDDHEMVVANPNMQAADGIVRLFATDLQSSSAVAEASAFYRPLPMATFWLTRILFGPSTLALHLGNVAIHALNAFLLALVCRRAEVTSWRGAAIVGGLFALAPLASEPVYWISGRFDLLALTFALVALLGAQARTPRGAVLTAVACVGGLLSKESFFVWLPVLALFDFLFPAPKGADDARRSRAILYAGAAAAVGAVFLLRRAVAVPSLSIAGDLGARALLRSSLFLVQRFLSQLVWPAALDPFHPYAEKRLAEGSIEIAAIVVVSALALARRKEGPRPRVVAIGLLWFLLATVPSALVGPSIGMIGDRYAYLPAAGLFLAFGAFVGWLDDRLAHAPRVALVAAGIVAAAEGWVTARRGADWHDDATLAESSLRSTPENDYALYWLGTMAAQRGKLDEADRLLSRSLASREDSWRTWDAVCFVRLNQKRLAEGERACFRSLELYPKNPRTWVNLASLYVQGGRWADAADAAARALALKPAYAEAEYLAAVAAANLGDEPGGVSHLRRGLAIDPNHRGLKSLERQMKDRGVPVDP